MVNLKKESIKSYCFVILVGLIVGLGVPKVLKMNTEKNVMQGDYSSFLNELNAELVLVGLSTCPYCQQAQKLLDDNNVAFYYLQLDFNAQGVEIFKKFFDIKKVPILISQNKMIVGFHKKDMMKIIEKKS